MIGPAAGPGPRGTSGAGSATEPAPPPSPIVAFGPFELDTARLRLYRDGERTDLAGLPCRVLSILVRARDRVVPRSELRDRIWGASVVGFDDRLNTSIASIRSALGDRPGDPTYVATVRGVGYRFVAQVRPADGAAAQTRRWGRARPTSAPWGRGLVWSAAVFAGVAVFVPPMGSSGDARSREGVADVGVPSGAPGAASVDPVAWDLYLRATALSRDTEFASQSEAATLLERAVRIERDFDAARARLAMVRASLSFMDRRAERGPPATRALRDIEARAPGLPETSLAVALHRFFGARDYGGALEALEPARRARPGDPEVLATRGWILRRAGRWAESTAALEAALAAAPTRHDLAVDLGVTWERLGDFERADRFFALALDLSPTNRSAAIRRALLALDARGEADQAMAILERTARARAVPVEAMVLDVRQLVRMLADRIDPHALPVAADEAPVRILGRAIWHRQRGQHGEADRLFGRARDGFLAEARAADDWRGIPYEQVYLAYADAELGEGGRALARVELVIGAFPLDRDALTAPYLRVVAAEVLTLAGFPDAALARLAEASSVPAPISAGRLRLDPVFEPLRGHSRWAEIVASATVH